MNAKVKDEDIISYIDAYILEHGYAPSYREIGTGVGLNSSSSVYSRVQTLLDKGLIESDIENSPRAIRSPRIILIPTNN